SSIATRRSCGRRSAPPRGSTASTRGCGSASPYLPDRVDHDVDRCRASPDHSLQVLEHVPLDLVPELGEPCAPVDVQVQLDRDAPVLAADANATMPVQLARDEAANSVDLQGGVGGVARENLARDARLAVHSISVHSL